MRNRFFQTVYTLMIALVMIGCNKGNDPTPNNPEEPSEYLACVPELDELTLDIATWNIQFYAASDFQRQQVREIVETLNADIIALQEITNQTDFDELVADLEGWQGVFSRTGDLNLAYLYKTSEVSMGSLTQLFLGEFDPFPRAAALVEATHVNGTRVSLINIHLKCCGGDNNIARRAAASAMLEEYVDQNLPSEKVIILGDFNDYIYSAKNDPVTFQNFLDASDDYQFVDMEMAKDTANFSYPGWPSHIDHVLVTDELFNQVASTQTLLLNACSDSYEISVSDHLPVMVSLSK